jgi:sigma-B regulation protein RsbU (phosphoserine phosphatase)
MATIHADFRTRFDAITSRLGRRGGSAGSGHSGPVPPALDEDYWTSVRDLFTRDVTGQGLHQLLHRETSETLRFFTREVNFNALSELPWYKRYPIAAWKVFLAMAYRLNPPRRVLFAVSVPLLFFGWIHYIVTAVQQLFGGRVMSYRWDDLLLFGGTLVLALLLLELRDKLSLKGDLEIARQIQFGLLPFEPFQKQGIAIRASMRPANTIGGDYFDVIELDADRLAVAIGDVAGKGMPAALLMALLQGSLRTLITAGFRGPELIAKLNAHLFANIPPNRLVTFFYAELDLATGLLSYVNAGHNPPFLTRAHAGVERLAATGIALGIVGDAFFAAERTKVEAGDRLLLYTDGFTEAENPRDDPYGEARLTTFLESHRSLPDDELLRGLTADVLAFCDGTRPSDDMTALVVSRA